MGKRKIIVKTAMFLVIMVLSIGVSNRAYAKTIKLSQKTVKITVGNTKKISVKNVAAKKIKKVKLQSSAKKIVKVSKISKTKFKVKGLKKGSAKVTVTLKIKKNKKLLTKKLKLAVKVKSKGETPVKRVDDSKAVAVMKAATAKLFKGGEKGIYKMPVYDSSMDVITDMVTDAGAKYTVPAGVNGTFDVYLEIGKAGYVAGETMYSITVNGKEHYCIPAAVKKGFDLSMGRFLMGKDIPLKSGDTVTVMGNMGFSKIVGKRITSNLPMIGNLSLYPAGIKVPVGYDGGVLKNEKTDASDVLSGKTIVWLGSSVTYGYGSDGYSMADEISRRHKNTTCYKYAISGTTLVNEDGTSYVARMKRDIRPDMKIDLFVVQLSTNDASQNKALGTLASGIEPGTFNDKTVMGAMETIISYAKETWNCPVVFYTGTKYESVPYEKMVQGLYQIANKWNIGLVDLWGDAQMSSVLGTAQYKNYMKDSIHPTKTGYVNWWTPKFEKKIAEILKSA